MLMLDSITMFVGFTTIFCVLCALYPSIKTHCQNAGYYWKDLSGNIPFDAIKGGLTVNAKPIYIGQILYKDGYLIPAKIYWNDPKRAFFEYGEKEEVATQNIKILCGQYVLNFVWIKTNISTIGTIRKFHHLISGGYQPGYTTFIGRIRREGELTIGKVLTESPADGLHVSVNGKKHKYSSYEVLTYNQYQPLPFP